MTFSCLPRCSSPALAAVLWLWLSLLLGCSDDTASGAAADSTDGIDAAGDVGDPFGPGPTDTAQGDTGATGPDSDTNTTPTDAGEDGGLGDNDGDSDGVAGECPTPAPSDDPCVACVCVDGAWSCAPMALGTGCTAQDCCEINATCKPCSQAPCPPSGLSCEGEPAVACSDGGVACKDPKLECVEGECICTLAPAPNGTACVFDSNACTVGDFCTNGICAQGAPAELEDGNPCTAGLCVKGIVEQKPLEGSCSDGNPCTFGDTCVLAQCVPDALKTCPTSPCAPTAFCDPDVGDCVYEIEPDGTPCVPEGSCGAGECSLGACLPTGGAGSACSDNNLCTVDSCVDGNQCAHTPVADGVVCAAGSGCQAPSLCVSGVCQPGSITTCNDGNSCTSDTCDGAGGCTYTAIPGCGEGGLLPAGTTVYSEPGLVVTGKVPQGITAMTVSLWGAGGGGGTPGVGGGGAWVRGTVGVSPGDTVELGVASGGIATAGGGASYAKVNGAVVLMAGGGGGAGVDGCSGCSGSTAVGAGGGGGPLGGAGGDGTANLYVQTNSLGGKGATASAGGAGGLQQNTSGFGGCEVAGGSGSAYTGGAPHFSSNCGATASVAQWNFGGAHSTGNGGGGGGGAGYFGGGAGASKWTYTGGGGGGGASFAAADALNKTSAGGQGQQPGGTNEPGYILGVGKGGGPEVPFNAGETGGPGLIVLTL